MLGPHEVGCRHRYVPCPHSECEFFLAADELVEHFERAHGVTIFRERREPDPDVVEVRLECDKDDYADPEPFSWDTPPCEVNAGWAFPCAHFDGDKIYIWLQLLPRDFGVVSKELRCKVTLDGAEFVTAIMADVYPIDWSRDKIIANYDGGAYLTVQSITEFLTEKDYDNGGFKVRFRIVENKPTA